MNPQNNNTGDHNANNQVSAVSSSAGQNTSQSNNSAKSEPNTKAVPADSMELIWGVISYIGPLVIVSLLVTKDPFGKFHIKQGLILFILEVAVMVVGMIFPLLWLVLWIVNLATFVLSIVGIINVVRHEEKALPIVGKFASNFKF